MQHQLRADKVHFDLHIEDEHPPDSGISVEQMTMLPYYDVLPGSTQILKKTIKLLSIRPELGMTQVQISESQKALNILPISTQDLSFAQGVPRMASASVVPH